MARISRGHQQKYINCKNKTSLLSDVQFIGERVWVGEYECAFYLKSEQKLIYF